MKAKKVKESLNEWVYSDTGINMYNPDYIPVKRENPSEQPEELDQNFSTDSLDQMIPPVTVKLTPEDFKQYIDQLINEIIPKSPLMAISIFKTVLKNHPYITRKPIGFKSKNPYEPIITEFLMKYKLLTGQ